MSDIASGLPNERETPFVDPWSKKPNHQGVVPVDALFVGAWDNDLGIDSYNEALFLGPVGIHREFITAAAIWIMAAKL